MIRRNFLSSILGFFGLTVVEKAPKVEGLKEFVNCRFLLTSEGFPTQFVKNIHFDYQLKMINLTLYDNNTLNKWAENVKKNKDAVLKFTMYDAFGKPISSYNFSILKIMSDTAFFDYENHNLSVRNITLNYQVLT